MKQEKKYFIMLDHVRSRESYAYQEKYSFNVIVHFLYTQYVAICEFYCTIMYARTFHLGYVIITRFSIKRYVCNLRRSQLRVRKKETCPIGNLGLARIDRYNSKI